MPLSISQASQLLWAAGGKTVDGITGATRSYPSAGGIYPLEIYLAAGNITGLKPGIYRYRWKTHRLERLESGDRRTEISRGAYDQNCLKEAPAIIIIVARTEKTASRYGSRGKERYVAIDTGHAGQNIALQARALGMETVMVGAFNDGTIKSILGIKAGTPYYLIPVGKK